MTTNPVSSTTFSNSTAEESKENIPVLPHHIFEKALPPVTSAQPLGEVTQLTEELSEESKELLFLRKATGNSLMIEEECEQRLIKGTLCLNGNHYSGQFFNDLYEGRGALTFTHTGVKYVGQFHEGRYHGTGILITPNGKYEGGFKDGFFEGFGIFKFSNGDIFMGNYVRGIRQGQGTLYYNLQGGSYTGEYQNDRWHGFGTLTSRDGDTYVGQFEDGQRHGDGKVTFANGDPPIEGLFINNLFAPEDQQKLWNYLKEHL